MRLCILLRNSFSVSITLLLSGISIAQVIQPIGKNNNINYEKLARVDGLINDYINKHWLNGAVTIIVKDNQVVQHKGYGMDDADTKKAMSKDAIFRIASQTKAITSVGIMILYEQGKFLLDEPISNFMPEFKNPVVLDKFNAADTSYTTVPARRDITFRDLLTHTSGIDYPGIGSDKMKAVYGKVQLSAGFGITKNETLLSKMKQLAKLPLVHQPGEGWTYGLNCDLLGCLIEVISGTNLENFLTKNIFEPLDMKDTYFNVPTSKAARLVTVYREDSLHHIIKWEKGHFGVDPAYPLVKKQYFSGGADLSSTAYDYAIFLQMMLNGGTYNGREILSRRTVEIMLSGQLDYMFNGDNNFGLGFEIVTDKGAAKNPRNKGSFAWGGFFGTTYWADPKEKLICLILTQQTPNSHGDLSERFTNMVYSSLK
jgi:CubicO group peptidase (beta-lactamase class C family)